MSSTLFASSRRRLTVGLFFGFLLSTGAVSHWLDRPQTFTADAQADGGLILTKVDEFLQNPAVLTWVWSVREVSHADARLVVRGLPGKTATGLALAGQLSLPVTVKWHVPDTTHRGEVSIPVTSTAWQTTRLPEFPADGVVLELQCPIRAATEHLAVSQVFFLDPLHGQTARTIGRLATGALTLTWIALLATSVAMLLRRNGIPAMGLKLIWVAFIVVAATGYLVFWTYFAHPVFGTIVVAAIALAVAAFTWRDADEAALIWRDDAWRTGWLAMAGVGVVYLGFLHAWTIDARFSWLAAQRYNVNMPADNWLPQVLAERVLLGLDSRKLDTGWLTSDRPPLQAGWALLLGPLLRTNSFLHDALNQLMGFWFQLMWIPALAALFELLGLPTRRALALVMVVALTGFTLVQSIYVWPKMAAAALIVGSWVWLLSRRSKGLTTRDWSIAGLGFGLGYLSHGGAAFALLAAVPCLLFFKPQRWRGVIIAGVVATAVYGPWLAYQKFYQPPGNRLLKWHLAGAVEVDARGTWQSLRDAYRGKTTAELLATRRNNSELAFWEGDFSQLVNFSSADFTDRRNGDFFHLLRSVGWWNAGLLLLPFACWKAARTCRVKPISFDAGTLAFTVTWVALTLAIWLLVLFQPRAAYIHHGSYVPPLLSIGLGVWSLYTVHRLLLLAVAGASLTYFAAVYAFAPPITFRSSFASSSVLTVAGGAVLCFFALRARSTRASR